MSKESHHGKDIFSRDRNKGGEPVYACATGTVVPDKEGDQAALNGFVLLYHGNGVWTRYGHMWDKTGAPHRPVKYYNPSLNYGDVIKQGEQIGIIGKAGATVAHLHMELLIADDPNETDPKKAKSILITKYVSLALP